MAILDFRAWDYVSKKLSYDVTLFANGWTELVFYDGEEVKRDPLQYVIMQYSGFTDKKGNKIFEGDIVKVIDMPSSPDEKTYITEIVYKDGCFFLANVGGVEIPLFSTAISSYPNGYKATIIHEVIDNIFEYDQDKMKGFTVTRRISNE